MYINEQTYVYLDHHADIYSCLRIPNKVNTPEEAELIVVSGYMFGEHQYKQVTEFINTWAEFKRIYIDATTEIIVKNKIKSLMSVNNVKNVTLLCSPREPSWMEKELNILESKGMQTKYDHYFLRYMNYYSPIRTSINLEHKKYLMMVGKNKWQRILLLSLMAHENLLDYGHISYTGNNQKTIKFSGSSPDKIFTIHGIPTKILEKVKSGYDKLNYPFILDTEHLDYNISHSREYNADYYDAVDFVVVLESNFEYKNTYFPTEKVAKCIQLDKKMIVLGTRGFVSQTIDYYKNMGKDISYLFNWCDISYDDLPTIFERAEKITETIKNIVS